MTARSLLLESPVAGAGAGAGAGVVAVVVAVALAVGAAACGGEPGGGANRAASNDEGRSTAGGFGQLAALVAGARIVDLSHAYDAETIYWPTAEGFVFEKVFAGKTDKGYWYEANNFRSAEHGGTHLDAPVHFARGRRTVEQIPVASLIAPGIVVDVSDRALAGRAGRDYRVTVEDFERWESARGGKIEPGTIVLVRTGFGKWWRDRVRYMGTAERGERAVAKLRFPGIDPQAAEWLVSARRIGALGLDTPSVDYGRSDLFRTHQILFEADVPAFENVAALEELPARGFLVVALPMKIHGGSGAPLRAVAIVPEGS